MAEVIGFGTKMHYGNVGASYAALATGWTAVALVTDITPPDPETDDIETTNHDTTTKDRTFIGGLTDNGEVDVTCQYDKTAYAAMVALRGQPKAFRIMFSDASGVGFNGFIKKHKTEVDMENLVTMSFTMKVSGVVTAVASIA